MGAPKGNSNAARGTRWRSAIDRALDDRSRARGQDALQQIALKLIEAAAQGDLSAIKEIGDRLDGRAIQAIAGHDLGPLLPSVDATRLSSDVLAAIVAASDNVTHNGDTK